MTLVAEFLKVLDGGVVVAIMMAKAMATGDREERAFLRCCRWGSHRATALRVTYTGTSRFKMQKQMVLE